jgi:hypothetical protein
MKLKRITGAAGAAKGGLPVRLPIAPACAEFYLQKGVRVVMNPSDEDAGRPIPSRGYVKLDSAILYSSLWVEQHDVVRVWIAMLAMADASGLVRSSVPALAHLCFVTVERMREILEIFKAPDRDSRIQEYDGCKIREVEGGWVILNYLRYRDLCQRKYECNAEKQKAYRDRHKRLVEEGGKKK